MYPENLKLVGTSHIAKESLKKVEKVFENDVPDIVAVELDKRRLHSLFQKEESKIRLSDASRIGVKGFVFSVFGAWAEKKLGNLVGVSPGSEMKKAITLARKHKKKVALIDQDIEITLRRFSKALTWKEKGTFVMEIIKAVFGRRKDLEFDLSTVPSEKLIQKLLLEVEEKYPNVYKVLIEERNIVMTHNLQKIAEQNPDKKIVAFVGAGHLKGIREILKKPQISYSISLG